MFINSLDSSVVTVRDGREVTIPLLRYKVDPYAHAVHCWTLHMAQGIHFQTHVVS